MARTYKKQIMVDESDLPVIEAYRQELSRLIGYEAKEGGALYGLLRSALLQWQETREHGVKTGG